MVTAQHSDGSLVTRNALMFKLLPHESPKDHPVVDSEDTMDEAEEEEPMSPEPPSPTRGSAGTSPVSAVPEPRCSSRPMKPPRYLPEEPLTKWESPVLKRGKPFDRLLTYFKL